MTKILEFLKKFVLGTILKQLLLGIFYGVIAGVIVALVAYAVCDLNGTPLIPLLQEKTDIYLVVKLYFCGWGAAGMIAKLLPW